MNRETSLHIAARIWCDQDFSSYTMNEKLAEKIAKLILKEANRQDSERQIGGN